MIDIDKIEELNERYGNRVDELRKVLGFLDQGEFDKILSGNDERGSNTSRIESGTNAKFSSSVRLACIFNVELIVMYQLYKPLQIVEYTGLLSFEERYKSELALWGHRMRKRRKSLGMSLADLANITGIDSSNLGKYERAERAPELITLYIIATALELEMEEMFIDLL